MLVVMKNMVYINLLLCFPSKQRSMYSISKPRNHPKKCLPCQTCSKKRSQLVNINMTFRILPLSQVWDSVINLVMMCAKLKRLVFLLKKYSTLTGYITKKSCNWVQDLWMIISQETKTGHKVWLYVPS